jgi:hypothetical protein
MAIVHLTPAEEREIVLGWMQRTPLEEMGRVLTVLANKVYAHRSVNKGYVPPQVFEQLLGPVTVSVQLVHEVLDVNDESIGYALRRREAHEVGDAYAGKHHNVCCSLRWFDTIETALARHHADVGRSFEVEHLGTTYHHEAPRRNMDLTFMYRSLVPASLVPSLHGDWCVYTHAEIAEMLGKRQEDVPIVLSNVAQLCWVADPSRKEFGVLYDTFPKPLLSHVPEWMRE